MNIIKKGLFFFLLGSFLIVSCSDDDDDNQTPDPDPVLGCMDSTANNYNADATEDDGSCTFDPTGPTGDIDSVLTGTWFIATEVGALKVGPAPGAGDWWQLSEADLTTRACLLDDDYVFGNDYSFSNVLGDESWVEPYQGNDPEGCAAPVAPQDGSAEASFTHDQEAGTITIVGSGAYLGLPKAYNMGVFASPSAVGEVDEIVYTVDSINTIDGHLVLSIEYDDGAFFTYYLVRSDATEASPLLGTTYQIATEVGALKVGPAPGAGDWWQLSEADLTTRACLLDDDYVFGNDYSFSNVLGDESWVEPYQGNDPEGCAAPVAPQDGSAEASFTHDQEAGTITIVGSGAYLGLPKAYNMGVFASPGAVGEVDEIIYTVDSYDASTGDLVLSIEYDDGAFFTYKLVLKAE